ncbi:hypothetical protein C4552_03105 [Candidatus Parcubacteria bacterium]|nr:MAG: hypothetical protein C4552_03105 [Candidatus Parcubacteria bacterium]
MDEKTIGAAASKSKLPLLVGILVLSLIVVGVYISSSQKEASPEAKVAASSELKRLLEAAAEDDVITNVKDIGTSSFEILVGPDWYLLTYEQKTKTLSAISTLHRTATGNFLLKARDYTSGRVVGEVNALGNIKIY